MRSSASWPEVRMQAVEFSPKMVQLLFNRETVATIFDFRKESCNRRVSFL